MERQTTPSITGQTSPDHNKTNSSIKPNKFHSKYVCFGRRKTREKRKIALEFALWPGPRQQPLARWFWSSTLIGPFKFGRPLKFKRNETNRHKVKQILHENRDQRNVGVIFTEELGAMITLDIRPTWGIYSLTYIISWLRAVAPFLRNP